jgi:hypothetical protein
MAVDCRFENPEQHGWSDSQTNSKSALYRKFTPALRAGSDSEKCFSDVEFFGAEIFSETKKFRDEKKILIQ